MLQLQYLNTKLKKTDIEQILSNYNIKYTTMKKEIENKIDIMIKTFNQDISSYLNNMEEIAEQKQKLKSLEYNQAELDTIREQLKDKIHELTKLKREIELLKNENKKLKNNNIYNPKRKRDFSPSFTENNFFNSTNISFNSTQKKLKVTKSILFKKEKKENKEIKFTSPPNSQMTKSRKKIRDLILSEKCKKIKIKLKKEKDTKNILLNNTVRTELKTESNFIKKIKFQKINYNNNNKKDRIIVTKKKFLNKNKNLSENLSKSSISNKNMPKIEQKVTNWKFLNNKNNRNLKNVSKKTASKAMSNSENIENNKYESIIKKDEDKYYEKDNESIHSDSENNSEKTLESLNDENDNIDDEINEMNDIEEEILTIMEQIKEFQKQKNDLT